MLKKDIFFLFHKQVLLYEEQQNYFIGTLLNEPDQNFGYHMGDTIAFYLYGGDDDERALVSNMNEINLMIV